MKKEDMLQAFEILDKKLGQTVRLIVGGGAALNVGHGIPIVTQDVDAVPDRSSMELADFKKEVRAVGRELGIPQDWLNDYYGTFLFVLPNDYEKRLVPLFRGEHLHVMALGKEDLLLMKCFAGREKDVPHAKTLVRRHTDVKLVDRRIDELKAKKIPGAERASDFLSDICDELGVDL